MTIHELLPYLRFHNPEAAISFYRDAFGAIEDFRLTEPGGRIGHAELRLGGGRLLLSAEYPEMNLLAPTPDRPAAVTLHLHVADADALVERAIACGATLLRAPADAFYGERSGTIRDPFGYDWLIGHQIEEVTPAEMQRRYDALFAT